MCRSGFGGAGEGGNEGLRSDRRRGPEHGRCYKASKGFNKGYHKGYHKGI